MARQRAQNPESATKPRPKVQALNVNLKKRATMDRFPVRKDFIRKGVLEFIPVAASQAIFALGNLDFADYQKKDGSWNYGYRADLYTPGPEVFGVVARGVRVPAPANEEVNYSIYKWVRRMGRAEQCPDADGGYWTIHVDNRKSNYHRIRPPKDAEDAGDGDYLYVKEVQWDYVQPREEKNGESVAASEAGEEEKEEQVEKE